MEYYKCEDEKDRNIADLGLSPEKYSVDKFSFKEIFNLFAWS